MDIAEKLLAQGYHIDRRKISLTTPIKVLGEYNVPVKLHREVTTTIKVHVEPDEESKAKIQAAAEAQARANAHVAHKEEAPVAEAPAATPEAEQENA
jgi:hypothetical protein